MLGKSIQLLTVLGNEVYMHRESASYIDELEVKLGKENSQRKCGETEDILTGVYNKNYIEDRMQQLYSASDTFSAKCSSTLVL